MSTLIRSGPALMLWIILGSTTVHGQNPPTDTEGSLHQNQIAIRLEAGSIQLRATPLDESIIRLLTPETYRALRGTRERFRDEIEAAATEWGVFSPTIFLVTAIGAADEVPFYPDQLAVTSQNILRRPVTILPLSPQWNAQRLSDRETVSALYLFDGVAVWEPFIVHYDASTTDGWEESLRALERERSRVRQGSAGGGTGWYFSSRRQADRSARSSIVPPQPPDEDSIPNGPATPSPHRTAHAHPRHLE